MLSSFLFLPLLLGLSNIPNTYAQSTPDIITDPFKRVDCALASLQTWYDFTTGIWTTGWWNSANIMTTIGNYAKANPDNVQLQGLARDILANAIRKAATKNPQPGFEDGRCNETSVFSADSSSHSGYDKYIDPDTHVVRTTYPSGWANFSAGADDATALSTHTSNSTNANSTFTPNPSDWLDGFYDDDLWWALAWINAYDLTQDKSYLTLAEGIFKGVTKAWPTTCSDGGIWWRCQKDYVNAIANELFFSTAAHLANRIGGNGKVVYVDWAQRSLQWFLKTGMINGNSTINDGLTVGCVNNNSTTWVYNQGVILGGLVQLNIAAPKPTYLPLATRIAKSALAKLSDSNGVIHDECEAAMSCGGDGTQFKGIFMRNLAQLHEAAPDSMFIDAIQKNAESIWTQNRQGECAGYGQKGVLFDVNWGGPFMGQANASTQSSAMDALVAAVQVGKGMELTSGFIGF